MPTHPLDTGQDLSQVPGVALVGETPADLTGDERYAYFEADAASQLAALREERNKLLAETDWWSLTDSPTMTQAQTDYRQALRDITNTYTRLDNVVWPSKP